MASVHIDPIATGIKDALDAITGVKAYKWFPKGGLDSLPACVVYIPSLRRTDVGPDLPEDHIGARDLHLDFPVHFYFSGDDASFAQGQIAEVLEAAIDAIDNSMDAGQPLNGDCDDVKLVEASEPGEGTTQTNRKVWVVETRVRVIKFI